MRLTHIFVVFICFLLLFVATCAEDDEKEKNRFEKFNNDLSQNTYVPEEVALVDAEDATEKPLYLFLFTHTEDHINHELSEERYWRTLPLVEAVDEMYPEIDLTWTIMFMGADAETVLERNDETGLVDEIQAYVDSGIVEIGYHAHHDPTYLIRPQTSLSDDPSFEEGFAALDEWISCAKDPIYGGCIEEDAGPVYSISEIGTIELVSGVGYQAGAQLERDFGAHALKQYLPHRMVGFGLPDHGATVKMQGYRQTTQEFMTILSPTSYTSGSVFWMNDLILFNDGNPVDRASSFNLLYGSRSIFEEFDLLDKTKPHVINVGIATKYMYTVDDQATSPTKYGYSNPDSPELPDSLLFSEEETLERYETVEESLYDVAEELSTQEGSKFVSADQVQAMVAPDAYFTMDRKALDVLARYILTTWDSQPPIFATNGLDHYSLRDMIYLLSTALSSADSDVTLAWGYGPFGSSSSQPSVVLDVADVKSLAASIAAEGVTYGSSYTWVEVPANMLEDTYDVSSETINTAQLLYALAYVYSAEYNGETVETVTVPTTQNAPETLSYLDDLGCYNCLDSAWSLKPATFYNLVDS